MQIEIFPPSGRGQNPNRSHGGRKRMKAALCSKTTVLFMPLFAGQAMNSRLALEIGFSLTANKYSLSKDNPKSAKFWVTKSNMKAEWRG